MKILLAALLLTLSAANLVPHCVIQHNVNQICFSCQIGYKLVNGLCNQCDTGYIMQNALCVKAQTTVPGIVSQSAQNFGTTQHPCVVI